MVQIPASESGRRSDFYEDVHRRTPIRVVHQGQVDQLFNRPISKQVPHPITFPPNFLVRRMRGPLDANTLQVLKTNLYSTIRPI